jgi:hypothetical protein
MAKHRPIKWLRPRTLRFDGQQNVEEVGSIAAVAGRESQGVEVVADTEPVLIRLAPRRPA